MRILFSYGIVGRGGDAIQVQAFMDAFRQLGHEVEVVGARPLKPFNYNSVEGHSRSFARRLPWWAKDLIDVGLTCWLLVKILYRRNTGGFDFVFHRASIYDFLGRKLSGKARCPLVAHLDAPFPVERSFRREGYFTRLHRYCMRRLSERSSLIVTMSQASRNYYEKLGFPEEKIVILPNGVSTQFLERGRELRCKNPPFAGKSPFVIGFAGSFSRWHRVDLLLDAFNLLQGNENSWCLKLVGYGEEYGRLKHKAKKLGLEGEIEWSGALPHEETFKQMGHFDVAILPGTLPTGAPIKLFEYAAAGRPIIAPDLPNLRQLFSDEEICFVKAEKADTLAEAILKLRENPDKARSLGERAQQKVAQYTWESIAESLLDILRQRQVITF